jgi:PEGA domain-containing protein
MSRPFSCSFSTKVMPESLSVLAAATTLAEWARDRRRTWSDEPLPAPVPRALIEPVPSVPPMLVEPVMPDAIADAIVDDEVVFEDNEVVWEEVALDDTPLDVVTPATEEIERPSVVAVFFPGLTAVAASICVAAARIGAAAGSVAMSALEGLRPLGESSAAWLMRGAAVVSTLSVVMVIGVHRGQLFARWDRVAAMVVAATNRPPSEPQPVARPTGTGRLSVKSANGVAQVMIDGTPRGTSPVTVDLPAGAHRVLLRSEKGSVERAIRIQAGEPSEVNEAIFPGWLLLSTPIDLSLSEDGQALKRDERGWAILPPGPHDIHLDNRALGLHEVRHVVVTPGDTTRVSYAPQASTLSLTTNELADVWIDGVSFGQAPLVDQPIALGVHDVRVRSALHERWLRLRATVQPVQVNVDLTADRPTAPR